jgi:hypothetical protein
VHSTIYSRMHGTEGDMELKTSPGRRLEKIRYKIFGKLLLLLPSLQRKGSFCSFCYRARLTANRACRMGEMGNHSWWKVP